MKSSKQIDLSLNQQAYIETIHALCRNHGHAHTKSIAAKLKIRMASVTEAMRGLATRGLVNYEVRKSITLTAEGEKIAIELEKRHATLADFFHNILGCSHDRSETIACQVEHIIDEKFCHRLAEFAHFLKQHELEDGHNLIGDFQAAYSRENLDGEKTDIS